MKRIIVLLLFGLMCLTNLAIGQTKTINCDKSPSDYGYSLSSHTPGGMYAIPATGIKTLSLEKISLSGGKMLEKVGSENVLNSCVLDYLFEHQELIPAEWKTKYVVFMGTILVDAGSNKFFPTLYWWDNHWEVGRTYLKDADYDDRTAAVK